MDNRIPYTYFIYHRETKQYYYGSKYGRSADPKLFWKIGNKKGYFTNSKLVKRLILEYGPESFDVEVRMVFSTPSRAIRCERRAILKIIGKTGCLNGSVTGPGTIFCNNSRRLIINGESSYSRAGKKMSETMSQIDHETGLTRGQIRGLKIKGVPQSPEHKMNIKIANSTPERIQQKRDQMTGNRNIVHLPGVKDKILVSLNEYFNSDRWKITKPIAIKKMKETCIENGIYEKHSQWMLENNPTSLTNWYNDGKSNFRLKESDLQISELGLKLGRLKFSHKRIEYTCPHCGKIGKGPNMKRYHFDKCKVKINE